MTFLMQKMTFFIKSKLNASAQLWARKVSEADFFGPVLVSLRLTEQVQRERVREGGGVVIFFLAKQTVDT